MDYIKAILRNIVLEDKEQVLEYEKTGEDFKYYPNWKCFYCGEPFYLLEDFKTRITTCPHCESKHKTKIFKNGKYRQTSVKFK